MPHLVSPPGICLLSTFNELYPFIFYRHYTMAEYAFFVQKADWGRKDMAPLWGNLNICPLLHQLQLPCHSQVELSSLNGLKVWGRDKSPTLTSLSCWDSGTDWPYTLVWLHEGTCHAPLPKEGHLGVLPQRGVEVARCGQISQPEVCQLLVTGPPSHLPCRFEWA